MYIFEFELVTYYIVAQSPLALMENDILSMDHSRKDMF
jgi:hypothetical protein